MSGKSPGAHSSRMARRSRVSIVVTPRGHRRGKASILTPLAPTNGLHHKARRTCIETNLRTLVDHGSIHLHQLALLLRVQLLHLLCRPMSRPKMLGLPRIQRDQTDRMHRMQRARETVRPTRPSSEKRRTSRVRTCAARIAFATIRSLVQTMRRTGTELEALVHHGKRPPRELVESHSLCTAPAPRPPAFPTWRRHRKTMKTRQTSNDQEQHQKHHSIDRRWRQHLQALALMAREAVLPPRL